jgi:hypothetical protein
MNLLDKIVVFQPLKHAELEAVLDIELGHVQKRVLDTAMGKFLFRVTPAGRKFLLQEGTDQRYGARHLKRAIERYVVYPLANLLATRQVSVGDLVRIDWDGEHKELTFVRESQGALLLVEPAQEMTIAVAAGDEGLGTDAPVEAVAEVTKALPALPAAGQAVARQSLQNRKKNSR